MPEDVHLARIILQTEALSLIAAGRKSALLLYRPGVATMESGESGAEWSGGEAE